MVKTYDTTVAIAWEVGEIKPWKYSFKVVSWKNQITHVSIHSLEQSMWIAMWNAIAFLKLTLYVINQSMLKSNDASGSTY